MNITLANRPHARQTKKKPKINYTHSRHTLAKLHEEEIDEMMKVGRGELIK